MDKKTHLSVLKVLAEAGVNAAVEDSEIIALTGLPHAIATRVFFELTESNHPMIEKVDSGDGTISYRLIVEPDLIGLNMDLHGSAPAPAGSLPEEMLSQDESDAQRLSPVGRERAPSVGTQAIGSYTFGVSKVSDDILRILLETPKTGSDLLEEIPASPDQILAALEKLEATNLVGGIHMELDSEKAYSIADDYRDDIELTLMDEFVYKDEPQPLPRASVVSVMRAKPVDAVESPAPVTVSEPAPLAQSVEPQSLAPAPLSAPQSYQEEPESTEGLGAVAKRDIKQRNESIQKIHEFLAGKRMSKTELFDKVLPFNAVRKLKILFDELLASGEIREIQEGRSKFIELGSAVSSRTVTPAPRPAERQPQEPSPALGAVVKEPAQAPAFVAEAPKEVAQTQQIKPSAPAPVATRAVAQPEPQKRPEQALPAGDGIDMFAAFHQMQKRLIELEAENRILREFMDKVTISAKVA